MARRRSIVCGAFSGFSPSFPHPSIFHSFQCKGCLASWGWGGSWLGCQVLPAIGAVSILELVTNSGGSTMSQAPNLHTVTQLLTLHCSVSSGKKLHFPSSSFNQGPVVQRLDYHYPLDKTNGLCSTYTTDCDL